MSIVVMIGGSVCNGWSLYRLKNTLEYTPELLAPIPGELIPQHLCLLVALGDYMEQGGFPHHPPTCIVTPPKAFLLVVAYRLPVVEGLPLVLSPPQTEGCLDPPLPHLDPALLQ